MKKGLLHGYVLGLDGLYRRRATFGDAVEIVCRDKHGHLVKIERLERPTQPPYHVQFRTITPTTAHAFLTA